MDSKQNLIDKNKSTRFLKHIMEIIEKDEYSFRSKTDWNTWNHTREEMKILAKNVIEIIKNEVNNKKIGKNNEDLKYSQIPYDIAKREKITFSKLETYKYAKIYRTEEGLERIITILSKNKCKNQLVTLDEGHIDLVFTDNKGTKFIELKQWKNDGNSPLFAIVESLKNYFLYLKLLNSKDCIEANNMLTQYAGFNVNELLILAPFEYYYSYWKAKNKEKRKKWETLKLFVEELNRKLIEYNIKVTLKYIDIPYGNQDKPQEKSWLGVMKSFNIYDTTIINLNEQKYKNKFNIILNELCTWQSFLENIDSFINKCEKYNATCPDLT